jgi:hypothetical protein
MPKAGKRRSKPSTRPTKNQPSDSIRVASHFGIEPHVGIFWLVSERLLVKSSPVGEVATHANFKDHEASHFDYWEELVGRGAVPFGAEYDEFPRGRVVYNTRTDRFTVMLDRCILNRPPLLQELVSRLQLPLDKFDFMEDSHYRCPACLARRK